MRNEDFCGLAGQHVKIEITNMNVLGIQLRLQDQSLQEMKGDAYTFNLLPSQTKAFNFYRFDYSPMLWQFELNSAAINEVVNVIVRIYSTWVPGDPKDSNHPYKIKYK